MSEIHTIGKDIEALVSCLVIPDEQKPKAAYAILRQFQDATKEVYINNLDGLLPYMKADFKIPSLSKIITAFFQGDQNQGDTLQMIDVLYNAAEKKLIEYGYNANNYRPNVENHSDSERKLIEKMKKQKD